MNRELIAQLYSSDECKKRAAVYRFLFDRRHDLLDELKKAASFEQNEDVAVFMAQVCLNLETFFRDSSLERQILELLNKDGGLGHISAKMWEYLITTGTSSMLIGVMGVMGKAIPTNAQEFMEACLNHLDPDVRAVACQVAINSGRPTHFAHVLNLVADPDPIVSETAFMVVKELPPDQMAVILDYALGSTDEWVLQNVAAFLPLIINSELRKVIAKHQYHSHPLVSQKSREALRALDAKTLLGKTQKAEKAKTQELIKETVEEKSPEKIASFKEQMELKKQQKLEEERQRLEKERQKKEEEEQLNSELAKVNSEELESFDQELKQFGREAEGPTSESFQELDDQAQFIESADFKEELKAFENIAIENVEPDYDTPLFIMDLAAASDELDAFNKSNDVQPDKPISTFVDDSDEVVVIDLTQETRQAALASSEAIADKLEIIVDHKVVSPEATPAVITGEPEIVTGAKKDVDKPGMIRVKPDSAAQYIMTKYPSFIQMPYSSLFKPGRPEVLLKALQLTVDHLAGYLNLCFIQSCLFFAPTSEMLERSIKDCLKGYLVGPTSIRCLHNFALAMKQSRENPIFFTFTLSQVFSESSDTNPLMLLRELAEYLKDPITPLEESIPQAIEGMTEILRGCKAIMNNDLVMKAPRGAKEPFADLNGPLAQVLPADKRPALDLPEGEVILISRDGNEALGLFPFFKYSKRRVDFARPTEAEMKILLERLEIHME